VAGVLYITNTLRDFRPSVFGKLNTCAQIAAVFFVMLHQVMAGGWVTLARRIGLYATFAFTLLSGLHYIVLIAQRLRANASTGASA